MQSILTPILNAGQEGKLFYFRANNYDRITYKHEKYTFKNDNGKCNTKSLENWTRYIYVTILPFKLFNSLFMVKVLFF